MTASRRLSEALPSLVLLGVAAFYAWVSFDYSAQTRAIPLGVAGLAILLVLVDLASQGEGAVARRIRRVISGSGAPSPVPGLDGQAGQRHAARHELAAFGWIAGFLVLAIVTGFYIAIPLYVIAYLRIHGGKPILVAAATGLGLVAVLYGLFEILLGYEVFGGLITGDYL
ncbi:hypothetical protein HKCCE2091_02260 [Rhodobacterales bacterium HKCCE2091]|nr:hypothetical protein [Rhodobacterales bacterium HKCCE2091]